VVLSERVEVSLEEVTVTVTDKEWGKRVKKTKTKMIGVTVKIKRMKRDSKRLKHVRRMILISQQPTSTTPCRVRSVG
jgi:hypothetical protein